MFQDQGLNCMCTPRQTLIISNHEKNQYLELMRCKTVLTEFNFEFCFYLIKYQCVNAATMCYYVQPHSNF